MVSLSGVIHIRMSAKKWRLKGDDPKFYKLESDPECSYVQD